MGALASCSQVLVLQACSLARMPAVLGSWSQLASNFWWFPHFHVPSDQQDSMDCEDMSPPWLHAPGVGHGLAGPQCRHSGVMPPQSTRPLIQTRFMSSISVRFLEVFPAHAKVDSARSSGGHRVSDSLPSLCPQNSALKIPKPGLSSWPVSKSEGNKKSSTSGLGYRLPLQAFQAWTFRRVFDHPALRFQFVADGVAALEVLRLARGLAFVEQTKQFCRRSIHLCPPEAED